MHILPRPETSSSLFSGIFTLPGFAIDFVYKTFG